MLALQLQWPWRRRWRLLVLLLLLLLLLLKLPPVWQVQTPEKATTQSHVLPPRLSSGS